MQPLAGVSSPSLLRDFLNELAYKGKSKSTVAELAAQSWHRDRIS